jgi:hypothetical protein
MNNDSKPLYLSDVQSIALDVLQAQVGAWLLQMWGPLSAGDVPERVQRFQEEANELCQAMGLTRKEAHMLVEYTWDRPVGEPHQEVGGAMTTLAALCFASGLDLQAATAAEFNRCNGPAVMQRIREKQALKPKSSPLPGPTEIDWAAERELFHQRHPMPEGVILYNSPSLRNAAYGYEHVRCISAAISHDKLWFGWRSCVEAHQ